MKMSEIVKGLIVVFADPDPETEITMADCLDLYVWVREQERTPRPAMVPVYDMDRLPTHLTTAPMPPVQDGTACTVTAGSEAGGEPADTHTQVIPPETEGSLPEPRFAGRGCADKRRIYERLLRYKQERGLGALAEVAAVSGMTQEAVRDMAAAGKHQMADWQAVDAALDLLEKEEKET